MPSAIEPIHCPTCGGENLRTPDTRGRRRVRECDDCNARFVTLETIFKILRVGTVGSTHVLSRSKPSAEDNSNGAQGIDPSQNLEDENE